MMNLMLKCGTTFAEKGSTLVTTTVDSGIVICIWDKINQIAGICHYCQSSQLENTKNTPSGKQIIIELLKSIKKLGGLCDSLEAKVIGASIFTDSNGNILNNINKENAVLAKNILKNLNIPVIGHSLGGICKRKVEFDTSSGKVKFTQIANKKILTTKKVLIVDDSAPIRKILNKIITEEENLEVMGEASNPIEAKEIIAKQAPDIIILDIEMPVMDGIQFLEEYMPSKPIPTIMVSSLSPQNSTKVLRALELGAFDYIEKPSLKELDSFKSHFIKTMIAASKLENPTKPKLKLYNTKQQAHKITNVTNSLILIGASTGGTEALKEVISRLPENIPPIVIVLHMPVHYTKTYANRLNEIFNYNICEAEEGMSLQENSIYLAPGGSQTKIMQVKDKLYIRITDDPKVNRFKPSVDYLFNSALAIKNMKMVAVVLTGMGSDGAEAMVKLKEMGVYTIGQDEKTSTVYGMPKVAFDRGGIVEVRPLDKIASSIVNAFSKKRKSKYNKVIHINSN